MYKYILEMFQNDDKSLDKCVDTCHPLQHEQTPNSGEKVGETPLFYQTLPF